MRLLNIAYVLPALLLASCGFTPMYATPTAGSGKANIVAAMSKIAIRPIPDRPGMKLRQELRELLQPKGLQGAALYDLDVTLTRTVEELGIRSDATASRANLVIAASFYLAEGGSRVYGDRVQSVVGYNILDDQYATVAAQADAEDRAIRQVGEQIKTRVGVYLERHPKPATTAAAAP